MYFLHAIRLSYTVETQGIRNHHTVLKELTGFENLLALGHSTLFC